MQHPHHVTIRRNPPYDQSKPYQHQMNHDMWVGKCRCGASTQFWFWGATLGYMFHHQWKESHNGGNSSTVH